MHGIGIESLVLQITRHALLLVVVISGIPVVCSMVVGIFVSVFQAATQIQEQTLTFVPKLLVCLGTILIGGFWMLSQLVKFTQTLFALMPKIGQM